MRNSAQLEAGAGVTYNGAVVAVVAVPYPHLEHNYL